MKHNIIVKWNEGVSDKAALMSELNALFAPCTAIEGVHGCALIPNCIDRPNRYDLLIAIDMDADALPRWDESRLHHAWKDGYGSLIASKAIFDYM